MIAEGFAKRRNPIEAARFFEMAMAESDETSVHFEKAGILAMRFKRIDNEECELLSAEYTALAKQLNKLASVQRKFSIKKNPKSVI